MCSWHASGGGEWQGYTTYSYGPKGSLRVQDISFSLESSARHNCLRANGGR